MAQQAIGTDWLIPQRRDPNEDAAFKQLIGQMKSMDEVRPFMCPKSGGSTEKCEKCDGFRTCTAGQMAVRLTMEQKQTFMREVTDGKKVIKELPNPPSEAAKMTNERDLFIRACESGNAWNYLMETLKISKDAAGERLSKLIKKYPGLAAEYGGGRRIMQRPKVVKITEIAHEPPVAAQEAQEPASAPKEEQTAGMKTDTAKQAQYEGQKKGGAVIRERIMAVAKAAFDSGDPIAYLVQSEGCDEKNARARVKKYCEKYPELAGDYQFKNLRRGRKVKQPEAVPEAAEIPETQEEQQTPEEDEVSLEDFLRDYEFDEAEADRIEAELQPEPFPEPAREPRKEAVKGDPMVEAMKHRQKELETEEQALRAEIERLEHRITEIGDQKEALELCLARFVQGGQA